MSGTNEAESLSSFPCYTIIVSLLLLFRRDPDGGRRTPEPSFKNPRTGALFNKWRGVWLMTMDRQRKLQDALDHLNEVERLKNFKFEPWRKRFLQFMRHNKARIMEIFRRLDRDRDGRISRREFIDAIFSTSKCVVYH